MLFLRAYSSLAKHFRALGRVRLLSLLTQVGYCCSNASACVLNQASYLAQRSNRSTTVPLRYADNLDARRKLESWERRTSEPNPVTAHLPGELFDMLRPHLSFGRTWIVCHDILIRRFDCPVEYW